VEDALVGDGVDHGLHLGKQLGGLALVAGQDSLLDVLDSGTVLGTQRGVGSVQFDVLADALATGCQAGVLFLRLGCHDCVPLSLWMLPAEPKIVAPP
jgi:hypothetical protein